MLAISMAFHTISYLSPNIGKYGWRYIHIQRMVEVISSATVQII